MRILRCAFENVPKTGIVCCCVRSVGDIRGHIEGGLDTAVRRVDGTCAEGVLR
jgi:hypothetical protein